MAKTSCKCFFVLSPNVLIVLFLCSAAVLLLNAAFVVKVDLDIHETKHEVVRQILHSTTCEEVGGAMQEQAKQPNKQQNTAPTLKPTKDDRPKPDDIPKPDVVNSNVEEGRPARRYPLCDNETKVTECEIPFSQFQYPANVNLTQLVQTIKLTGKAPIGVINTYKHTPILSPSLPCGRSGGKSRRKTEILFLIKSLPANSARRQVIRETWGNEKEFPDIRRVFVIGLSINFDLQEKVMVEGKRYGDILQYDFLDTYFNLTLKAIGCMMWSGSKCKNDVNYVIMADDDYYVATDFLVEHLRAMSTYNVTKVYMGGVLDNSKPQRDLREKWFISLDDYPFSSFPPIVRGGTLVLSIDLMHDMSLAAPFTKMMPFDDVYMAIIAYKLGVTPIMEERFSFQKVVPEDKRFRTVLSSHGYRRLREMRRAWKCHDMFRKMGNNATQPKC